MTVAWAAPPVSSRSRCHRQAGVVGSIGIANLAAALPLARRCSSRSCIRRLRVAVVGTPRIPAVDLPVPAPPETAPTAVMTHLSRGEGVPELLSVPPANVLESTLPLDALK